MTKDNNGNINESFKRAGNFLISSVQAAGRDFLTDRETRAYEEGLEIGIQNTVAALFDADVDDNKIIQLLIKFWGINMDEASQLLIIEKRIAPIRELEKYLRLQGYSEQDVKLFIDHNQVWRKVRQNIDLQKLRRNPKKFMEAVKSDSKIYKNT